MKAKRKCAFAMAPSRDFKSMPGTAEEGEEAAPVDHLLVCWQHQCLYPDKQLGIFEWEVNEVAEITMPKAHSVSFSLLSGNHQNFQMRYNADKVCILESFGAMNFYKEIEREKRQNIVESGI